MWRFSCLSRNVLSVPRLSVPFQLWAWLAQQYLPLPSTQSVSAAGRACAGQRLAMSPHCLPKQPVRLTTVDCLGTSVGHHWQHSCHSGNVSSPCRRSLSGLSWREVRSAFRRVGPSPRLVHSYWQLELCALCRFFYYTLRQRSDFNCYESDIRYLHLDSFVLIISKFPPLIEPVELELPSITTRCLLQEVVLAPLVLNWLIPRDRVIFLFRRDSLDTTVWLIQSGWLHQRLSVRLVLGSLRTFLGLPIHLCVIDGRRRSNDPLLLPLNSGTLRILGETCRAWLCD